MYEVLAIQSKYHSYRITVWVEYVRYLLHNWLGWQRLMKPIMVRIPLRFRFISLFVVPAQVWHGLFWTPCLALYIMITTNGLSVVVVVPSMDRTWYHEGGHFLYSIMDIIYYVQLSLFAVSGLICVPTVLLFGIYSDRLLCKINICCYKRFTTEKVTAKIVTILHQWIILSIQYLAV